MNSLEVFENKHSDEESNDEDEYEGDDADDENLPPLVVADQLLTPLHLVGSQLPHHICSLPLYVTHGVYLRNWTYRR